MGPQMCPRRERATDGGEFRAPWAGTRQNSWSGRWVEEKRRPAPTPSPRPRASHHGGLHRCSPLALLGLFFYLYLCPLLYLPCYL